MHCKFIVLLTFLLGSALGENCPVFTWDNNSPSRPALSTIPKADFAEMMKPKTEDRMTVLFTEDGMSLKDFSCSKSSTGATCYTHLAGSTQKNFYMSVENPVEAVSSISLKTESVKVDEYCNLDHDVACQAGKLVIIDLGESSTLSTERNEVLAKHDECIHTVYEKIAENCKITALYTCTPSTTTVSKSRSRRAADSATSGTMFRSGKDFLIFFTDLIIREQTEEKKWVDTHITISEMNISGNDTAFTVNLNGGSNKLSFLISLSHGYFKLSNLVLNEKEEYYVPSELTSPTDFSYTCGNQTFANKENSNKFLVWNSLQMQAPFSNATSDDFKFGDAWYCVGFFSSGILAGLFVVFILLGIMSVGICWMLDINTMDRFDDPKGKTITINVNE